MKSPKKTYKYIFLVAYYSREKLSKMTITSTSPYDHKAYELAYKKAKKILNDVDFIELQNSFSI
jgi:hypothetical protein